VLTIWPNKTFLIIKPTRCTNFSKYYFFNWNSTCFGQFLYPSSGVFHCTQSNGIYHTGLLTACKQEHLLLLTSCQQTCMKIYHCCVYSGKLLMMDRRTVRYMQSFISKIKFGEISVSSWFYYKKFITMHGHMSVKCNTTYSSSSTIVYLLHSTTCFGCPDQPSSGRGQIHKRNTEGERPVFTALWIITILFQKQKIWLKQIHNHVTEFLRNRTTDGIKNNVKCDKR